MSDQLEVILTLSPAQRDQMSRDLAELRRRYGSPSATHAVLEALRREAANGEPE